MRLLGVHQQGGGMGLFLLIGILGAAWLIFSE